MTKRAFALALAVLMVFSCMLFSSCGEGGREKNSEEINIVCSIFPIYDWAKNIACDREGVNVTLLVKNGADMHSYQPTAADIVTVRNADVVIYVGGESDEWLREALDSDKKNSEERIEISLTELSALKTYGISKENIIADEHGEEEHEHGALDEHIWLSLDNALTVARAICDALSLADAEGREVYSSNLIDYERQIEELKREYIELCGSVSASDKTMVFADRFPFVYLCESFDIPYFAAFEGCTSDTDADFSTVSALAKRVDELGADFIYVTESSDKKLAESVISASKSKSAEIIVLDSMQSFTAKDIESGASYISVMRKNLDSLRRGFNQ